MSQSLEQQTRNALDFVQKLFLEISYLIKEVEGLLYREEERFVIGRPSGYGVTSGKSTGLEPTNVEWWLPKAFTVIFVPEEQTSIHGGITNTPFHDQLKVLLLDIELEGKKNKTPRILAGFVFDINVKRKDHTKFEHLMFEFVNSRDKVFAQAPNIIYEDSYVSMKGEVFCLPLFSISSSDEVSKKVVEPMLAAYRRSKSNG